MFHDPESSFDARELPGKVHVGLLSREKTNGNLHGLLRMILTDAEDAAREVQALHAEQSLSASLDWAVSFLNPGRNVAGEEDEGFELTGINFMLAHDLSGVTIVCNDRYKRLLNFYGISENCSWAPCTWTGYEVFVSGGADSQRLISHVSTLLSDSNVSILNYSTFASDYILVQDHQKSIAADCFAMCTQYGVGGMIKQMEEKAEEKKAVQKGDKEEMDPSSGLKENYSAYLRVLEATLKLSYCTRESLTKVSLPLIKQVLNNLHRGPDKPPTLEGGEQGSIKSSESTNEGLGSEKKNGSNQSTEVCKVDETVDDETETASVTSIGSRSDFFWAYLSIKEDVTFIHDHLCVSDFPRDTVHQWNRELKAVKLCGKDIPFNATGIVKTMVKPYEDGLELINISTYKTNLTLVAKDSVDAAVNRINRYL